MITTLPASTAEIVNAVLPRNAAAKGTVERKIAQDVWLIALANGKIAVKVPSGELSEGDSVALFSRGSSILIEKMPPQQSGAPVPSEDTVSLQTAPDSATLKLLADTAADQLKKQVLDKDTLEQLQRILAAVAKNPSRFGEDTVNAVSELKKIVAAMPSGGADVAQTARELAGRIIDLGEKFAERLKSGAGAVDVVLRNGTAAREGYYSFDNVTSAISWLSENKEIQENVPWQKLSTVFSSGPVVIKVYESAIGDMRASFVAPEQTADELSHFAASTLKADVWKNVSENVLANVLYDRKEIPLSRLLEIDALLKESEQPQPAFAPASAQPQESVSQSPALQSKGFEAALSQWLTIALDNDAPLPQVVSRVPVQSSQQIPSLLSTLSDVGNGQETASAASVRADDFSIRQETLASAQNPDTVLPDLFMRLGLNLESVLSKGDEAAADLHPQSLKTILLSLLGTIDDAAAKARDVGTAKADRSNAENAGNGFIKAVLKEVSAQLAREAAQAAAAQKQAPTAVTDAIAKFTAAVSEQLDGLQEKPAVPAVANQTEKQPAEMLKNVRREIIAFVKELPDTVANAVRRSPASLQAEQIVRQLEKFIAQATDASVPRAPAAPGDEAARGQAPRPDAKLQQSTVPQTQDASRTVRLVVSDVSAALERAFGDAARQARSLSGQISRMTDNAGPPQNGPDSARQVLDKVAFAVFSEIPAQIDATVQVMQKSASEEVQRLILAFQQARNAVSAKEGQPDAGNGGNAFIKAVLKEVSAQLSAESSKAVIALEQGRTAVADAAAKFTAAISERINTLQEKTFVASTAADAPAQAALAQKQLAAMLTDVKQEIMAFVKDLAGAVEEMVGRPSAGLTAAQKELFDLFSGMPLPPDKGEPQAVLPALRPALRPAEAPAEGDFTPGQAGASQPGQAPGTLPDAETPPPVLSRVAGDIGIAIKLLDMLASQSADDGAAPALLAAKQDLGRVFAEVNQAFGAATADTSPPPQAPDPSTAVGSEAAQRDGLTRTMNDSLARLVRQSLAGLDKVIGRLSEQIEQLPEGSSPASRREAVTRALAEFTAGVSGRLNALVREAGAQMTDYAAAGAGVLEAAATQQAGEADAVAAAPAEQVDMTQPVASQVSAQLEKAARDVQAVLSRFEAVEDGDIPARAEQVVRQLQKFIAHTADAFVPRAPGGTGDAAHGQDARPDALPQQGQSGAEQQFENLATAAGRQIMAKVNDVAEKLQDLGRQVLQLQDALSKNALPRDSASQANRQADTVPNSLKDAFRQLDSLAKTVSAQASTALHDTARQLDNLASSASKQLDNPGGGPGGSQHGPLDMLKQQVENALTRVESLQVLARQVPVTDGQQQVISLPMKIEGQWTDVVVKFLKKKNSGGKDAAGKPVSVAIHVSPAMLGQIDVFMDYGGKKRFSMRMEFEKPSTRSWFENNKADFSAALKKIGFAAFKIDMKEIGRRRLRESAAAAPKTGGPGIIDITA